MRNELHLSREVAPDGSSLHLWLRHEVELLVHSQKSGNTSKSDAPLRWSPPGVACEPILPTPAMMRTHRTGWTRRRLSLQLGWSQWKHLHILPTPVSGPGATKCSTCYIHESRIGPSMTGLRSTEAGGGKRRRTALTRRARSPLAPEARHCSRRQQR